MKKKKNQLVIAISGVSGAGKGTLLDFLRDMKETFCNVPSYTTRAKRPGEAEGTNRFFISEEEFDAGIKAGEFIEWEKVHQYRYGRKKKDVEAAIESGKIPFMEIDVKGTQKFKKIFPGLVSIFILPPSFEEAMKRVRNRGAESEEDIKLRASRYEMETSYKNAYDHILINDDLNKAKADLLSIIRKEEEKLRKSQFDLRHSILIGLGALFLTTFFTVAAAASLLLTGTMSEQTKENKILQTEEEAQTPEPEVVEAIPSVEEISKEVAKNPPKRTAPINSGQTTTNSDGTKTTVVSTGGGLGDLSGVLSSNVSASTPYGVPYRDETGEYSNLGTVLKDYLNNSLRWKNEITALKEIVLRNAGNTGWSGQYLGQYTADSSGKITNASGVIVLNAYYGSGSNFIEDMKLVFSHEYGHHYTLYHKWVDWSLPNGVRFPDSYYQLRGLSKTTTSTDYSKGWINCESEIIAEDYSYLYSGYGYSGVADIYGLPSSAVRNWLDKIGDSSLLNTIVNQAPTINIISPAPAAVLSGTFSFSAEASDDIGISKVSFYIDNTLILEDTKAPYAVEINTSSFQNGQYNLRAVVSDGTLSAEKITAVTLQNNVVDLEKPVVTIISPTENPQILKNDNLTLNVTATDNNRIDRIELYLDDEKQNSWKLADLSLRVSFKNFPVGNYTLKFRAFDEAGNYGDATLQVVKI
ncbi:MAG: guanylate kinase [Patescibacteria group bacterium]